MRPSQRDRVRALAILRQHDGVRDHAAVNALALALAAARRAVSGDAIKSSEVWAAHDLLHGCMARDRAMPYLAVLAEGLLSQGVVPRPGDYGGQWWRWWPSQGFGMCPYCGSRSQPLVRYGDEEAGEFRYRCAACRCRELADQAGVADAVSERGVSGRSARPWIRRRVRDVPATASPEGSGPTADATASSPEGCGSGEGGAGSGEDVCDNHIRRLEALLVAFGRAGWQLPDSYDCVFRDGRGGHLRASMWRTGMVVGVEYDPSTDVLRMTPHQQELAAAVQAFGLLEEPVYVRLSGDIASDVASVTAFAGRTGLLDATRVHSGDQTRVSQLVNDAYDMWVGGAAQSYWAITAKQMRTKLAGDSFFGTVRRHLSESSGRHVLPDPIPAAAALGVVSWCWRNRTAIEGWRPPSDVLMARLTIAATKAVRACIDLNDGVDWDGVRESLTDPGWTLPNGSLVAHAFGSRWSDVSVSVTEQIEAWTRLDLELLGAQATLRLLTVAGSTTATRHWWGQGRWTAICDRIVWDAVDAGASLPPPYDSLGADRLIVDLTDPDQVSDETLTWLIAMPGGGAGGLRGLRDHRDAARPVYRVLS
jgi:hypothetical protein